MFKYSSCYFDKVLQCEEEGHFMNQKNVTTDQNGLIYVITVLFRLSRCICEGVGISTVLLHCKCINVSQCQCSCSITHTFCNTLLYKLMKLCVLS